jgi:cell division protein FtsX
MHLVAALRFLLKFARTGLHAAVVVTASLSLFLLFLLWSLLQLVEEPAASAAQREDSAQLSPALMDRRAR